MNPSDLFTEVWQNLFSNSPDFKKAGDALYRQLGLNNSGQDWEILSSQIHNEFNELKRDAWVPLVLYQDPALTRPRDLFESLLIDSGNEAAPPLPKSKKRSPASDCTFTVLRQPRTS